MPLTAERLREIVHQLASKPKHEMVRVLVSELLIHELGVKSTDLDFERPLKEVNGRSDALLGRTIFELKSDLRRERASAEEELTRYIGQRERETNEKYIGIATDGATFAPYELRAGTLVALKPYQTDRDDPRGLVVWLDTAVSTEAELPPGP